MIKQDNEVQILCDRIVQGEFPDIVTNLSLAISRAVWMMGYHLPEEQMSLILRLYSEVVRKK